MYLLKMFSVMSLVFVFAGCGGGNTPEGAVKRYFKAMATHDIEAAVDLLDWEHQSRYPGMRYTEIAVIRSFLKHETDIYGYSLGGGGVFKYCEDFLHSLDEMVVEGESLTNAVVVCYNDRNSQTRIPVNNVEGKWKVAWDSNDNWIWNIEQGYDEVCPFCTNVLLTHFANRGDEMAKKTLQSVSEFTRGGKTTPKEAVETYLSAMADFDLKMMFDLMDADAEIKQSFKAGVDFENSIKSRTDKVSIAKKFREIAVSAKIGEISIDGDSAGVALAVKENDKLVQKSVRLNRRNGRWYIQSFPM